MDRLAAHTTHLPRSLGRSATTLSALGRHLRALERYGEAHVRPPVLQPEVLDDGRARLRLRGRHDQATRGAAIDSAPPQTRTSPVAPSRSA